MDFMLDENVPASVGDALRAAGHNVQSIRDYIPPGSKDELVATISERLEFVLVSFDGDFEKIAPRVPQGFRARFRKLSRIWLRCSEPQAAKRIEGALSLIEAEYQLAKGRDDSRMTIWLANGYIKTVR
jgi:predicted nuclease of predicted toxin-antitoxin system